MDEKRSGWGSVATLGAGLAVVAVLRQTLNRLGEDSLQGEVALVTGGSRGLGLALARELGREGCKLAICARDETELARAREDLEGRGFEVIAVPCDVGDRDQVTAMIEAVTARYGRIDLLLNNAGIIAVAPLETLTVDDIARVVDIDFWGVVYPTFAVLPQMRSRRRGRIVNVTSMGGKVSFPHMLAYTSAKFAATGFSEGLRAELATEGIAVTTVVPGEMKTGSFLHAEFGGDKEKEYRWFALGASAPFTMSADRAARLIVRAIKRGTAELIYPISARLAVRLNGLAPNLTAGLLTLANRLLPNADGAEPGVSTGAEVDAALDSPALDKATALGRAAAEEYNSYAAATTGANGQATGSPG